MINTPRLNEESIYAIPCGDHFGRREGEICLLYSPLAGAVSLVREDVVMNLERSMHKGALQTDDANIRELYSALADHEPPEKLLHTVASPSDYTRLSVLPTHRCNFSCSYCYSSQGRSSRQLDRRNLITMLDEYISPGKAGMGELGIFFAGGGEPLLAWPLVRYGMHHATRLAEMRGVKIYLKVITNGGAISDEMIRTFRELNVRVCVSFEILEAIQNLQRGSYDKVAGNIRRMISQGVTPSLNATITKANVHLQERMVETVAAHFPEITDMNFDPVMDGNAFGLADELKEFFDLFIRHHFAAWRMSRAGGRGLNCTMRNKYETIAMRYCPGHLCLTPEGTITACHQVSSPREEFYELSRYGDTGSGKVVCDLEKFRHLLNINVNSYEECRDCFARWHCGGGCLAYRHHYSREMFGAVCHFTRSFIKEMLLQRLEHEHTESAGESLQQMIDRIP